MKTLISATILSSLLSSAVFAEDYCSKNNETWTDARCATTASGVGAATGSGIYAAKKYSEANSIEKQFTERVFQNSNLNSPTDARTINRTTQTFTNGDRITIGYQLSEAENRQYHIDLMENNASSSRSSAATHAALALTATKTVTESGPNNTTRIRTEPDYAMRALYASMAAQEASEAIDYDRKAEAARRGEPVPTYDLEKVVDAKAGTAKLSADFVQERVDRGGKILKIDRLPVEKFNMMKNVVWKARGGVVGVAAGLGLAAEEAIAGTAANAIEKSSYSPAVREYGSWRGSR